MTLTPDDIRNAAFDHGRRGYDAASVDQYLATVADAYQALIERLDGTTEALDRSRHAEQSLRATVLAMSQAREDILDAARSEAEQGRRRASREADRVVEWAEDHAAEIVMDARRQALDVIAAARRDADHLLQAAHDAAAPLTAKVEQLRAVVRRTENLMRGLASGALGELGQAHLMLDEAPETHEPVTGDVAEMQIVFSSHGAYDDDVDDDATVSPLPAAVDRLLSHLREIG